MITRYFLSKLVAHFASAALIYYAHASRPLAGGLDPDVLIPRQLPLRIILGDAIPDAERVVELQADSISGHLVLKGLHLVERGIEPGTGPLSQRRAGRQERDHSTSVFATG